MIDWVGGRNQVVDAHCTGTLFAGFETILQGRMPTDAPVITERICGVCRSRTGSPGNPCPGEAAGQAATTNRPHPPQPDPRSQLHPVSHPALLPAASPRYVKDQNQRRVGGPPGRWTSARPRLDGVIPHALQPRSRRGGGRMRCWHLPRQGTVTPTFVPRRLHVPPERRQNLPLPRPARLAD